MEVLPNGSVLFSVHKSAGSMKRDVLRASLPNMKTTLSLVFIATILAAPMMRAEDVGEGQREVLGFIGGVTDGGGTTLGGGLQLGIRSRWLFSGEVGWIDAGRNNNALSVDANVHYLFPLRNYSRIAPYILGGLGVIDSSAGLNLGGGLRWKVGSDWGIRPEVKILIKGDTAARISIGIYKRF